VPLRSKPDNDNGQYALGLSNRLCRVLLARGLGALSLHDLSLLGKRRLAALSLAGSTGQA
jgi:hypothetical protein